MRSPAIVSANIEACKRARLWNTNREAYETRVGSLGVTIPIRPLNEVCEPDVRKKHGYGRGKKRRQVARRFSY